jgi:hypothetical protein
LAVTVSPDRPSHRDVAVYTTRVGRLAMLAGTAGMITVGAGAQYPGRIQADGIDGAIVTFANHQVRFLHAAAHWAVLRGNVAHC